MNKGLRTSIVSVGIGIADLIIGHQDSDTFCFVLGLLCITVGIIGIIYWMKGTGIK